VSGREGREQDPDPGYPETLTITCGPPCPLLQWYKDHLLADYTMVPDTLGQGRPVWRKGGENRYFFYSPGSDWVVGSNYTVNAGWIKSADSSLDLIPESDWLWADPARLGTWPASPTLRVTGEQEQPVTSHFHYPHCSGI
jgi:hypothetical protein